MPQVNYTIDDRSPLIQYQPAGAWSYGSNDPRLDGDWDKYSNNGTFMLCTAAGSSASLTFTGTSVWIFGAKRSNHGPYSVNLDGTVTTGSGYVQSLFQTPLFSATGLEDRSHTVTITNMRTGDAQPFLDIDFITWTSEVQNDQQTRYANSDSAFSYQPSTSWSSPALAGFSSSVAHSTLDSGASMFLNFSGESVTLYGATGPNAAPYAVQLDGGSVTSFNATTDAYTPQVILFHADNLSPGSHSVRLTNTPSTMGQSSSIDYALVRGASSTGTSPNASSRESSTSKLNAGAIAGIVVGAIVVLALLAALAVLLRRRKRAKQLHDPGFIKEDKPRRPSDVLLATPFPFTAEPQHAASHRDLASSPDLSSQQKSTSSSPYLPPGALPASVAHMRSLTSLTGTSTDVSSASGNARITAATAGRSDKLARLVHLRSQSNGSNDVLERAPPSYEQAVPDHRS
ncbi:hypothetical protein HGRIS_006992 [Hohenbuehelia grisea]|uniref:Transmembrane protein n=1 Tax=Hohenbuehelia grisea TaxID=104357 RepID=A0ABR3JAU2_9AGAR